MKPSRCAACSSDQLTYGRLMAPGFTFFNGFGKFAPLDAAACFECGTVIPYLDDKALAQVRQWNVVEAGAKKDGDVQNDPLSEPVF